MEKIKPVESEPLLSICSLMDVNPSEEEDDSDMLEVTLLFVETMTLKKSISIQKLSWEGLGRNIYMIELRNFLI